MWFYMSASMSVYGRSWQHWLTTEWNNAHSAEPSSPSSNVVDDQTPLLLDDGTSHRPKNDIGSNTPNGQLPNGKPKSATERQSSDQRDTGGSVSEEHGSQSVAALPAASCGPDPERRAPSVRGNEGPVGTLNKSQDSREFGWKLVQYLLRGGAKQAKSPSTIMIVITTVLFGLFVAQAIAGVFSAKIASDRAGLSSSQHCGIWQFNENAGGEAADRDDLNNYQKEARASQYARTCYNSPDPTGPFSCDQKLIASSAYFSSLYPESDYWQPVPELKPPNLNSTLTIIFVSSMHIYHVKPSFDPIFPSHEPRYFEDFREPLYYNADPRARALACVDTSELCSPDGETCWSMTSPLPPDIQSSPEYWLMKWSLENSNTYDSIKWRLGTALLAQESVSQSVSIPLSPYQWQLEASQLFATSLARIQYDAWKIATGEDRERPGYIEVTPDEATGRLCRLYKFKSSDYTNINLAAFVGLPLLAMTIFVLSWDARVVGLGFKKDESAASEPLIIDVIVRFIFHVLLALTVGICKGVTALFRKSGNCIKDRRFRIGAIDSDPS
ncbi:MAG: hypothetical protein ASARMPRED_007188 [Alectoria sarmentosa]|nr:MAG: hypothetical protein ASARMPRED_007188 [Alectoria sarmentosa]